MHVETQVCALCAADAHHGAGVFAEKPEFVVGKSIKDRPSAPAKPAAAPTPKGKSDSEDGGASTAAAGNPGAAACDLAVAHACKGI